jgi:uncharacterized protein YbaR (Trm112 family)/SAM-dependent methyltransferase
MDKELFSTLVCPVTKAPLEYDEDAQELICKKAGLAYPIVNNVPILINEENSAFRIDDFVNLNETTIQTKSSLINLANKFIPSLNLNVTASENIKNFRMEVYSLSDTPKILVVGCRAEGQGMQHLYNDNGLKIVNTDVALGNNTEIVADGHDIPFAENTFHGVVIQTVLEHVADPTRCVDEIHRVLKGNGIVFAETSFNQQIHMGPYDFTRFTHVGHRRLFRKFSEIDSGIGSGPGMALAWAYQYFLLSFTKSTKLRLIIKLFSRLTGFWLKYFDYYLVKKTPALDAAATCVFLGRKSIELISDEDVIKTYKGEF